MRAITVLALAAGSLVGLAYSGVPASAGPPATPASAGPRTATAALALAGKVVGIDPGHNGHNF